MAVTFENCSMFMSTIFGVN